MGYHDRWRNRKRLYKLDYLKYLRKYLPRVLRYLAYPSLALALLIAVDVSLPSTAGETYVPIRVMKVPETSQGGEALLYAFTSTPASRCLQRLSTSLLRAADAASFTRDDVEESRGPRRRDAATVREWGQEIDRGADVSAI
jgi:hypothetical protein